MQENVLQHIKEKSVTVELKEDDITKQWHSGIPVKAILENGLSVIGEIKSIARRKAGFVEILIEFYTD